VSDQTNTTPQPETADRAAGCDPEALRALIDLEQREKRELQREHDAARAELARLTAVNAKLVAALTNLMDAIVDEPFSGQRASQGLAWRDATAALAAAKEA